MTQLLSLNDPGKTFVCFNHFCALSALQVLSHHLSPKVTKMYEAAQTDKTLNFQVLPSVDKELNKSWNKVFRNKVEKSAEKYLIRYRSIFLACLLLPVLLHVVPAVSPILHAGQDYISAE